jgi:hypothetical protein
MLQKNRQMIFYQNGLLIKIQITCHATIDATPIASIYPMAGAYKSYHTPTRCFVVAFELRKNSN